MTTVKLVIFDCDGTLVDSQHNIIAAITWAFESQGLVAPTRAEVLNCVGLSLPETFRVLAADAAPDTQHALATQYRDAFVSGPLTRMHDDAIYPRIGETIAVLAKRPDVLLGVATGKSKRGVKRLFDREGWHDHFHTIQTADDHPSKPHPSMIMKAMAEAGAAPSATVMIGDTSYDMAMAVAAGVGAIGVDWGYHERQRLADAGAAQIVSDGGDRLVEVIDALFAAQLENAQR